MIGSPAEMDLPGVFEEESLLLASCRFEALFFMRHRRAQPPIHRIAAAAAHLTMTTRIGFGIAETQTLLDLYPKARILLAVSGGPQRQDVRDALLQAIADFFMARRWPECGDESETDQFLATLHSQAKAMGFSIAPAVPASM